MTTIPCPKPENKVHETEYDIEYCKKQDCYPCRAAEKIIEKEDLNGRKK